MYSAGSGRNNIDNQGFTTLRMYWDNSTGIYLNMPAEVAGAANFGVASAIAVSGSDVYAAASVGFANGSDGTPVAWKIKRLRC